MKNKNLMTLEDFKERNYGKRGIKKTRQIGCWLRKF